MLRRPVFRNEAALSSSLAIAVSMVAFGAAVRAQSFQATPTVVVSGSASVFATGSTTTVTVNSSSAVINWAPNDIATGGGAINFQSPGTTAKFINNSATTADFALLNNILPADPTRAVQFNGTILSQLQNFSSGALATGGTVYFYSPGGILVGPSAVINVGNLGLTTSPIDYNATTGAFGAFGSLPGNGVPQTVTFGQANAGSSVQILNGAQISANVSDGSYVAIVSPLINNSGTINVNGNAALVSADAATITFQPNGLYSIAVDVGTSASGTTLFNGGTITGNAASTGAIAHQIYMVTAPKNTLISLLIGQGSNIGFDVAGAANISGNSIILSGGYDVTNGTVNSALAPKGGTGGSVNSNVTSSNVTSALTIISSNNAQVDGSGGGTTTLAADVSVLGYKAAFLGAFAGSTLTANGNVTVAAIDPGTTVAAGTNVTGGTANIFASGGTVALHGAINTVTADANGSTSTASGVKAGNGTGGNAQIFAANGGSVTVDGTLSVEANGAGANSRTDGVVGGNGQGGFAGVSVSDSNASLTFRGFVNIAADGHGGTGVCTSTCTAEAGTGTGGSVQIVAQRGTSTPGGGSSISTQGATNSFLVSAFGGGGSAFNTNAASGSGGNVTISVDNGNALNLGSLFIATAQGSGGTEDGTKLTGGNGTGGNVSLLLHPGGTFNSTAQFTIDASGQGGDGDPDSAGTGSSGGFGQGGLARVFSDGGSGTFSGGVGVFAQGLGGFSGAAGTTGAGGAGTGGTALITIGNPTTSGNNATFTFSAPDTVNGAANIVSASGSGGSGYPGGAGTGGAAIVRDYFGTIQGTSLLVNSTGSGGHGATNGNGGLGLGGQSYLLARNNPFGASTINFAKVDLASDGQGGLGGNSFNPAQSAGSGGAGAGGSIIATADAGDGHLTVSGQLKAHSDAFGGNGGAGATSGVGAGGNGGAGGDALSSYTDPVSSTVFGGNAQIGSQSNIAGTTANGSANFGSLYISGNSVGGQGGVGGAGSGVVSGGGQGNGGSGGNAADGSAVLLVRGTPVTISGSTDLFANAIGGNGGAGAIAGNGGNAVVGGNGGIGLTVTNRNLVPTQRGSLTAGVIGATASATAGTGATVGTSLIDNSPINLTVTNSDVTATTLNMLSSASNSIGTASPSVIQASGGTLNLGSVFQFGSSGPITVGLDTATLNAGFVGLSGSDWILPTIAPTLAGSINATTGASFRSANNIVTFANVNFSYPVSFNVIGDFMLGDVTAAGDFISVSGGASTFGTINATNVDIAAGKAISVGAISTPGFVSLDNSGSGRQGPNIGSIAVGPIMAGRDVGLFSNQSILAQGLIQAGANVDIDALGSATVGNISAGLVNPSTTPGDTFEILVKSGGTLVASNLASQTDIGLLSQSSISAGTLIGRDIQALATGAISTGSISAAARVLLADASMAALGTTPSGYDPNPAFAAIPVRTSGSIAINGVAQAGQSFAATAGQAFSSGAITTLGGPLLIDAGTSVLAGNLVSSGSLTAHAGSAITTGTLNSTDLLVLGGATMTTGAINATSRVLFASQSAYSLGTTGSSFNANAVFAGVPFTNLAPYRSAGAVIINGDVNASQINVSTAQNFTVGTITVPNGLATSIGGSALTADLHVGNGFTFAADGDITTGAVDVGTIATAVTNPSYYAAYFAGGNLSTGKIQTRNGILMSVGGTATTGALNTGEILGLVHGTANYGQISATGRILLADQSMAALGNTTTPPFFFDVNLVFNAAPVASAGPITINGALTAASLTAASGGSFTSGTLTTTNFVDVTSGGNALVNGAIQTGQETSINAQGGITVGNINAGAQSGTTAPIPFSIGLIANGGSLVAGNLTGAQSIGLGSNASISTGTLTGVNLLAGAGTTIATGAISMTGKALLASYSMIPLGGTPGGNTPYDATPVFAATPVATAGAITVNGTVNTGQFFHAATSQGFTASTITTGTDLSVAAGGPILTTALTAGTALGLTGAGSVTTGNLSSGSITASGGPTLITGNLVSNSGGISLSSTGTLTVGSASSAGTLSLAAPGTVTTSIFGSASMVAVGNVTISGGDVVINPGSPLRSTAGAVSITATGSLTSDSIFAQTSETLNITGNAAVGGMATNTGDLTVNVGGDLSSGGLSSNNITINAGTYVTANMDARANISLKTTGAMRLSFVTTTGGTIIVNSGSTMTAGNIRASGNIVSQSVGSTNLQGFTSSAGSITATGSDITVTTPISSALNTSIIGTGALNLNTVTSTTGAVSLSAGTTLTSGAISAATAATLSSIGAMQLPSISAGNQVTITADSFLLGSVTLPGTIVSTGGGLSISTTRALTLPTLSIFGNVTLDSRTAMTTGDVTSTSGSVALSSGGTLNAGVISTTNGIQVNSTGAGTVQGLTTSGSIQFNTASTFTSTGNIVAANQIIGGSSANMTLANVTASGGVVELVSSQANVTTGRISALTDVATIAGGSLSVGQVSGRDIVLLAGSNVQVGNVSAGVVTNAAGQITGATGRVLIANASIGSAGGTFGNYNFNALFNSTGGAVISNNPPRIGGTVNLVGTLNAGVFGSYSQGAMTGQVINAFGPFDVESGGLVTVGQRWTSPDLSILSNDIAIQPSQVLQTITTTAGLSSGTTGTVTLASLNPNGAFIGDGLTAGQGYALSNAEVGLVQSGSLTIAAAAVPNLATTMTIGTLGLTGTQVSGTGGGVLFATGNPQNQAISGTIRIDGALTAKGFAAANQVQFKSGTLEIDNTAGSIAVTDSGGAQSGQISLSADHIRVAAASILDKLRADPLYAGRITDLNTAPLQAPSGPALSASQLFFAPTQTLYIQNTGTAAVQAGFLVPLAGLTIELPSTQSTQPGQTASAVSLVINGQFVGTSSTSGTGQGTSSPASITGATAFQQFVQQTKLTGITADSQFNGCLISAGSCSMTTPAPDLSTQIQVLQTPALPSAPAIVAAVQQASPEVTADPQQQEQTADKPAEAEQKEEKEAKANAKAPIAPPAPMIDTRPLSPPVSVDEPVAGGGNPALFGIGAAATQTEGGDK